MRPISLTPKQRRLAGKLAGLVGARTLAMGLGMVTVLLLARAIGPDTFGGYAVAQSVLVAVSGFAALGLAPFTLRAGALGHREAVGFGLALNLLTSAAIVVAGVVMALIGATIGAALLFALALAVAIEKNVEVRTGLCVEFGQSRLVNGLIVARALLPLAGVLVAPIAAVNILAAYVGARLAGVALMAIMLNRSLSGWRLNWRPPRDGTLASLPGFALGDLAYGLNSLEVAAVGRFATPAQVGFYSATRKVSQPVGLLVSSLKLVTLGPAARRSPAQLRRVARSVLPVAALAQVPMAGLAALAPWLTTLLLGAEFAGAAPAMAVMFFYLPALAGNSVLNTLLVSQGHSMLTAKFNIFWGLMLLALVSVGAALGGAAGAAAGLALKQWLCLASLQVWTNRLFAPAARSKAVASTVTPAVVRSENPTKLGNAPFSTNDDDGAAGDQVSLPAIVGAIAQPAIRRR